MTMKISFKALRTLSIAITLLFSFSLHADYSTVRCDFKEEGLMEAVFGKFKKIQTDCCIKRLEMKVACENREEYQKCANGGKGTRYAVDSGVECSEGCKLFREDCDDFIGTSEVNRSL